MHLVPVKLPSVERAIYLELVQLLAANDFNMRKRKENVGDDRAHRIQELLGQSSNAGEALMKCASHFRLEDLGRNVNDKQDACSRLAAHRKIMCEELQTEARDKLKQAEWLSAQCRHDCVQYNSWKSHVAGNEFKDGDVVRIIEGLIRSAEKGYSKAHGDLFYVDSKRREELDQSFKDHVSKIKASKTKKGKKTRKDESDEESADGSDASSAMEGVQPDSRRIYPAGEAAIKMQLRVVTNDLQKLSTALVKRHRCFRFLQNVRDLQDLYTKLRKGRGLGNGCRCQSCRKESLLPEQVSILIECGHTVCNGCLETYADREECLVQGCLAINKSYQVINAPELCVPDENTRTKNYCGKKLEEVHRLIKNIPEHEQVLLFVQFSDLMEKVIHGFKENKITYSVLEQKQKQKRDSSNILNEFQTETGPKKKKVLVMNIGDASAAGR